MTWFKAMSHSWQARIPLNHWCHVRSDRTSGVSGPPTGPGPGCTLPYFVTPLFSDFLSIVKLQPGSSHQPLVHHHSSFHVLYSLLYILHVCFCIVFLLDVYRSVTSFLFFVIFFSPKIAEKVRGSKNVTRNSDSYPKCRKLCIYMKTKIVQFDL